MTARMKNPATVLPDSMKGIQSPRGFTHAERSALALAESMTRLADRTDPVPDGNWDDASQHFNEKQMAGLILWIATTNLFNRVNATTKQPAGAAW